MLSHCDFCFTWFSFRFKLFFDNTKIVKILLNYLLSFLNSLMFSFPFHGLLVSFQWILFFWLDGFLKLKCFFSQLITFKIDLGNFSEFLGLLWKLFQLNKLLGLKDIFIFGKEISYFNNLLLSCTCSIDFSQSLFKIFTIIFLK